MTDATNSGICFRKSVPHTPGKCDQHPQQTVSWSKEVSEEYPVGNHLECRASIPENKSSDDCHYYSRDLTDGDMNWIDL